MDQIVIQGELFPEDSEYNSQHRFKNRRRRKPVRPAEIDRKSGRPIKDLTGQRFGNVTVIEMTNERRANSVVYICECDCPCKTVFKTTRSRLKSKRYPITHCGCQGTGKNNRPAPGALGLGNSNAGQRVKTNNPTVAFRQLLANYRHAAVKRGYVWELNQQQFLTLVKGDCFYCGVEPKQVYERPPHKFTYNGVDRYDSDKGYTVDNCVSCCNRCNFLKGTMHGDEFLVLIKQIYEHQNNTGAVYICRGYLPPNRDLSQHAPRWVDIEPLDTSSLYDWILDPWSSGDDSDANELDVCLRKIAKELFTDAEYNRH